MARMFNNELNKSQKSGEKTMRIQKMFHVLCKAGKLALLILLILGHTNAW